MVIGRCYRLCTAGLITLVVLLAPFTAAALVTESTEVHVLSATVQKSSGQAEQEFAAGPGYWAFRVDAVTGAVRELTVAVKDDCAGTTLWDGTVRSPSRGDEFQTIFQSLPASWTADPDDGEFCVELLVQGKRNASVTLEVHNPKDVGVVGPTVWAFRDPTILGFDENAVQLYLGGWAWGSDDGEMVELTNGITWHSDLVTEPLGVGGDIIAQLGVGVHRIGARATDASGFSNTASLTFTVADVDLSVDVPVPPRGDYRNRETVVITAAVTDAVSGLPIEGATVTADVVAPSGRLIALGSVTSDSSGTAVFTYRASRKDELGDYGVRVNAAYTAPSWLPDSHTAGFTSDWSESFTVAR